VRGLEKWLGLHFPTVSPDLSSLRQIFMLDHWGFDMFMPSSTSLDILKIVMIGKDALLPILS
jgi:hypothetical protein